MRRAHLVKPNSITANYLRIGSMGLGACIDKIVAGSDWKNKFAWSEPPAVAGGPNGDLSVPGAVATGSSAPMAAVDPVATTTPRGLPARGPRSAPGSDTIDRKLPPGKGIGIPCRSYICGAGFPIYS